MPVAGGDGDSTDGDGALTQSRWPPAQSAGRSSNALLTACLRFCAIASVRQHLGPQRGRGERGHAGQRISQRIAECSPAYLLKRNDQCADWPRVQSLCVCLHTHTPTHTRPLFVAGSGTSKLSESGSRSEADGLDSAQWGTKVAELIAGDAFGETSLITGDQGRLSVRTASLFVRTHMLSQRHCRCCTLTSAPTPPPQFPPLSLRLRSAASCSRWTVPTFSPTLIS